MENEFVTYEHALALKELGFDWATYQHYDSHTKEICDIFKDFSAPLKQQVLRWFREKHNLIGLIEGGYDSYKNVYSYVIWKGSNDDWLYYYWDTYEEAENACIDKLIEIVKKQDNGK
jgi:hypothetical protein